MLGKKHIENARWASDVWNGIEKSKRDVLTKYFHLRPTSSGVTIISTLQTAPMRGISCNKPLELKKKLDDIFRKYPKITSDDDMKARAALKELNFKERSTGHNKLEEDVQAVFINSMGSSGTLSKLLGSVGPIEFVASELIFEKGPYRIDVVGRDRKDLYFFELKKDRTLKVKQVADYREYYSSRSDILNKLLSVYPINSVDGYGKIRIVMVMRHAENSTYSPQWQKLEEQHDLDIIFFMPSIDFLK